MKSFFFVATSQEDNYTLIVKYDDKPIHTEYNLTKSEVYARVSVLMDEFIQEV